MIMKFDGHVHTEDFKDLPSMLQSPSVDSVIEKAERDELLISLCLQKDNPSNKKIPQSIKGLFSIEREYFFNRVRTNLMFIDYEKEPLIRINKKSSEFETINQLVNFLDENLNRTKIVFVSPILNYPEIYKRLLKFDPIVEAYNGTLAMVPQGRKYNLLAQEFARDNELIFNAGSDAKVIGDIGSSYMKIDINSLEGELVFRTLCNNRWNECSLDGIKKGISWRGYPKQVFRVLNGVYGRLKNKLPGNIF